MDHYIGTKEILATPMNRQKYNDYRGWELPEDGDGSDEGMLVEYLDSPNSNHENHKGYISWSPKEVFEEAYTKIKGKQEHHSSVSSLLEFFKYSHLPERLQKVSKPFCKMAYQIAELPSSPETTMALRKLLESKDCAVRAML